MVDKSIGFGIIGTGVIAPLHREAIRSAPGAGLVAVSDVDEEKARKFIAESGGDISFYRDYRNLLADSKVDAVTICTPSSLHAEPCIEAAKAGKHVLTEKPIDISLEKIDAMIEACRKAKVKLGCVFQRRTYPSNQKVREAVRSGVLGRMLLGDLYFKDYRSQAYYESAGWRGTWEFDGGGPFMNQVIHGIDLLLWIMGDVESVFARADHLARKIEVEDTGVALLKFKNGAFGVIEATTSVTPRQPLKVEIHGDRGTIHLSDSGIERWAVAESPGEEASDRPEEHLKRNLNDYESGHHLIVQDFARAIREDRDPIVTGESARKSVALVLAIYKSARTGKEVEV